MSHSLWNITSTQTVTIWARHIQIIDHTYTYTHTTIKQAPQKHTKQHTLINFTQHTLPPYRKHIHISTYTHNYTYTQQHLHTHSLLVRHTVHHGFYSHAFCGQITVFIATFSVWKCHKNREGLYVLLSYNSTHTYTHPERWKGWASNHIYVMS